MDQVPKKSFQKVAIEYATDNTTELGIPKLTIDTVTAGGADYEEKCVVTENPSTQCPAATRARDASWDVLEPLLVDLYNQYFLNNDKLSANDKAILLIHLIGGSHSEVEAQTTSPIVVAVSETSSMLIIVYSDSATVHKHAKPSGVGFLEIWGKVGDPAPVTIADCPLRYNVSRSHEGITFSPDLRGQNFYGFGRWVNKNGKQGPWGNMFTNKIP